MNLHINLRLKMISAPCEILPQEVFTLIKNTSKNHDHIWTISSKKNNNSKHDITSMIYNCRNTQQIEFKLCRHDSGLKQGSRNKSRFF